MPLTIEQNAALEAIANRATRYEVVVERPDGVRSRVGYTARHSGRGLATIVQANGPEIVKFLDLGDDAKIAWDKRGIDRTAILTGGGKIRFSGRTQRDAIMAGELPWVGKTLTAY